MSLSVSKIQQNLQNPCFYGKKQVNFGNQNPYEDDSFEQQHAPARHAVRNFVKAITGSVISIIGFNLGLYLLQDIVSSKLLVGKINKHFTDKISDNSKLAKFADEMRSKLKLNDVEFYKGNTGEAFYTRNGNKVVVGEKEYSSLFHELGHAFIENKTKFLKTLQRGRGNYTFLALALYALTSQNKNNPDDSGFNKFMKKGAALIPILAYSPELITEGMASHYGLKFLKSKREDIIKKLVDEGKIAKMPEKAEMISKEMFKNIKKSYITCFGTYLFVPLSIMILDKLDNWAHKRK